MIPPPTPLRTRLVWKETSVIVDDSFKEEILCLFLTLNYSGERADRTFYSSTLVFVIQGTGLVLWSEFSRYGLSVIMILSLPRQVLLTDCCAFVVLVSVLFFVCFLSRKFFCRSRLDKYNVLWLWFSSLIFPFAISSVQPTFSHEDRSLVNLLCPKIQIIIFFCYKTKRKLTEYFSSVRRVMRKTVLCKYTRSSLEALHSMQSFNTFKNISRKGFMPLKTAHVCIFSPTCFLSFAGCLMPVCMQFHFSFSLFYYLKSFHYVRWLFYYVFYSFLRLLSLSLSLSLRSNACIVFTLFLCGSEKESSGRRREGGGGGSLLYGSRFSRQMREERERTLLLLLLLCHCPLAIVTVNERERERGGEPQRNREIDR